MRAIARGGFSEEMRAVTARMLVVHGDKDLINPLDRTARPVAGLIPGAAPRIYEERPRDLVINHRERLVQHILTLARG